MKKVFPVIFLLFCFTFTLKSEEKFTYSIDNNARFKNIIKAGILPFNNLDGDTETDWIGYGLEKMLRLEFTKINKIKLAKQKDLYTSRNSLLPVGKSFVDVKTAYDIGSVVKCDVIIWGEYKKTGGGYEIKVEILNIKTKVLSTINATLPEDRFLDSLDNIVFQICDRLGIDLSESERRQIQIKETDNLEAFKALVDGFYDDAISLDNNWATAYYFKAEKLRGIDYRHGLKIDLVGAIENYLKAIELRKDYLLPKIKLIDAYIQLGNQFLEKGETDKAAEQYGTAMKIIKLYSPDTENNVLYYLSAGKIMYNLKEAEKAIEYYRKAVNLFPYNSDSLYELGRAYILAKRYDDAIKQFDKIIRIEPDYGRAYLGMGIALWKKGKKDKAVEYFQKALEFYEIEKEATKVCKKLGVPMTYLPPYRVWWEGEYVPVSPADLQKIDINNVSAAELSAKTGIPFDLAYTIVENRKKYGEYRNIYELRLLPGMNAVYFNKLKETCKVIVPYEKVKYEIITARRERIRRGLMAEGGRQVTGAVDDWMDTLLNKINVNKANVTELKYFPNVSLIDATSIVRYIRDNGAIQYRDWKNIPYLSFYGWKNLRDYIDFQDNNQIEVHGDYQLEWKEQRFLGKYVSEDYYRNWEYEDNLGDSMEYRITHKLKLRVMNLKEATHGIVDSVKAGGFTGRDITDEKYKRYKWFFNVNGIPYLQRIIVGNYKVSIAQGLVINNNDDNGFDRLLTYIEGISPDLIKEDRFLTLNGGAAYGHIDFDNFSKKIGRTIYSIEYIGFYSKAKRDAITNSDGTANCYIYPFPEDEIWKDKVTDKMYGGMFRINILPGLFIGTAFYEIESSRAFTNNADEIAEDNSYFPIDDPYYTQLHTGKYRGVVGLHFGAVFKNYSIEGEYAKLSTDKLNIGDIFSEDFYTIPRSAFILITSGVFNKFNLKIVYRNYQIDFDNPFARTFSEEKRFVDTFFEDKTYRLKDDRYYFVSTTGMPKAEKGIYAEISYFTISRHWKITKIYYDWWIRRQELISSVKSADGNSYINTYADTYNDRFQGEIEYKPVHPLRFRIKQKIKRKNINHARSITSDTRIRMYALLTDYDYFSLEYMVGNVKVRGGNAADKANTYDMNQRGNAVGGTFEHKFTPALKLSFSCYLWRADGNFAPGGYSVWYFNPFGIDFMEGDRGMHAFMELSHQVGKNLFYRFVASYKKCYFEHTDQERYNGYFYGRSSKEGEVPYNTDFTSIYPDLLISAQLNIFF